MFKHPGKKLKTLAIILFVIMVIIPVLVGLALIFGGGPVADAVGDAYGVKIQGAGVIIGILVIVFGFLSAWLSTIILYTLGEIADDLEIARRATVMIYHKLEGNSVKTPPEVKEAVRQELESKR